jgi:hypothetical protein
VTSLISDQLLRWNPKVAGDLVLFPGWARHGVPEQAAEGERVVVSGNIEFADQPWLFDAWAAGGLPGDRWATGAPPKV